MPLIDYTITEQSGVKCSLAVKSLLASYLLPVPTAPMHRGTTRLSWAG